MWSTIDRAAASASRLAFYVAVLLLIVLMVIGAGDVILTQLLGRPIPGAVELSEAAVAVLIFLGLGQVQRDRGHITMDLFTQGFSAVWQRRTTILSSLIELAFMVAMAAASWALMLRSFRMNETAVGYLAFPIYPAKALVFLGILLATLELARQTIGLIAGREDQRAVEPKVEDAQ
ncbi:MAG: TRAP transporter small permease [Mesorhizobium sp.]